MTAKNNEEIRRMIGFYGLNQWEVALTVGIRPETLSKWLREELDDSRKDRVMRAINQLSIKNG